MQLGIVSLLFLALISNVFSETTAITEPSTTVNTSPEIKSTSHSVVSTTTVSPKNESCQAHSSSCEDCIKNKKCYYCDTDKKCKPYNFNGIVPAECSLGDTRYSTCTISLKLMVILVGILAGIILLIILCICCWCCCKRKGVKFSKDDLKFARQREERRVRSEEKKKERADRTEEIRRKYGLMKDENPYQRFDA